jgi:hypothetical protein
VNGCNAHGRELDATISAAIDIGNLVAPGTGVLM